MAELCHCARLRLAEREKMNTPKISKRLEAAASFVQRGGVIADVGTDHAYLPIYLYASGLIVGAVASDVNQGPIDRAKANVRAWGADKAISVIRTDGLSGIEKYSPNDIFILGMGGELIVKILSDAEWIKRQRRLILQPMTHPEILREYLYSNGFGIVDEVIVEDDKIYQIICAEHTGEVYTPTESELFFGKINIERGGHLLRKLLLYTKAVYEQRIKGKMCAGADSSDEQKMIRNIQTILEGEKYI